MVWKLGCYDDDKGKPAGFGFHVWSMWTVHESLLQEKQQQK